MASDLWEFRFTLNGEEHYYPRCGIIHDWPEVVVVLGDTSVRFNIEDMDSLSLLHHEDE